jgi:hypothetical protein
MDVLAEVGVVQLTKVHQRGVFWRAQEVLDVLDAFATNAGKRTRAHRRATHLRRPFLVCLRLKVALPSGTGCIARFGARRIGETECQDPRTFIVRVVTVNPRESALT